MKNEVSKYLVYGLLDPRDGELRYVGKTCHGMRRPLEHTKSHGRYGPTHRAKWIRELYRATGQTPCVVILKECASDVECLSQEIILIAMMKACGYNLTNLTDGGDGFEGYKQTKETIEKQRLARIGKKLGPPSLEHRMKLRQAMLGRKPSPKTIECARIANRCRVKTPAEIEKRRQAILGRKRTAEHKEKIRQWNLGKKRSPEARAKMSEAQQRPETKAKIGLANRGRKMSQEICEQNRLRRLGTKASPEARRNMSLSRKAWYAKKAKEKENETKTTINTTNQEGAV